MVRDLGDIKKKNNNNNKSEEKRNKFRKMVQ